MFKYFRKPANNSTSGISALGNPQLSILPIGIIDIINNTLGEDHLQVNTVVAKYFRAVCKGSTLFSKEYRRVKVRNSFTVMYHNGGVKFGVILFFITIQSHMFAIVESLAANSSSPLLAILHQYITPVCISNNFDCIAVECILCKCVYVHVNNSSYCCKVPFLYSD